jgi:hypothetical protein
MTVKKAVWPVKMSRSGRIRCAGVWMRIGPSTEIWSEDRKRKDVTAEGRILLKIILKKVIWWLKLD